MRRRLFSVFAAGMFAMPGLSMVPVQAAPHVYSIVTPAAAEAGGSSLRCNVAPLSYVPCGSVDVGPGETLSVQVTSDGTAQTGTIQAADFQAFLNGAKIKDVGPVTSSDQKPQVILKNLTTSTVTVTMQASADGLDFGLLTGDYIVTGP